MLCIFYIRQLKISAFYRNRFMPHKNFPNFNKKMNAFNHNPKEDKADRSWIKIILKYTDPDLSMSLFQLFNTLIPYALLWGLMVYTLSISFWLTLPLIILAAAFAVRIFIIFHDCGHGSFFKSKKWNTWLGRILGILVFTPYEKWHEDHAIHHATVGNLEKRGVGDVWTVTVAEYQAMGSWQKRIYGIYRHPFILFGLGGFLMFVVKNRIPGRKTKGKSLQSIYFTNIGLVVFAVVMSVLIGFKTFLIIQLPVMFFAASIGVWLFYLQHQFTSVYWSSHADWDYKTVALLGCSYLKLPGLLRWFSGNIGYHHIHHLGPGIPNYHLAQCQRENVLFQKAPTITLASSFKMLKLRLYDVKHKRLISFSEMRRQYA